jgi:hypothetical protein
MLNRSYRLVAAAAVTVGISSCGFAAVNVDGTLTPGEGYGSTPLVTQVNVSTSLAGDNSGQDGTAQEGSGTTATAINQLSNAYAFIDTSTPGAPLLDMFIGGSFGNVADTHIEVALQTTTAGGVSSLATDTSLPGGLPNVQFQGFKPNVLLTLTPFLAAGNGGNNGTGTTGYGGVTFTNLLTNTTTTGLPSGSGVTGSGSNPNTEVGIGLNQALALTTIGAAGEPSFASVTTGYEFSIPLDTLTSDGTAAGTLLSTGYTSGSIEAFVFPAIGQSGRTDNQILSPFDYGTDLNNYDYGYLGTTNDAGTGTTSGDPNSTGRQFAPAVYPVDTTAANPGGNQFFTIPGASVPEPASLGFMALSGLSLLRRRRSQA